MWLAPTKVGRGDVVERNKKIKKIKKIKKGFETCP